MSPKRQHPRVQAGSCALCCSLGDGSGFVPRAVEGRLHEVCFGSFATGRFRRRSGPVRSDPKADL